MFIKIITDCNYAGCSTEHLVEVSDDATEDEIALIADELAEEDIGQYSIWDIVSEEEAEELEADGLDAQKR